MWNTDAFGYEQGSRFLVWSWPRRKLLDHVLLSLYFLGSDPLYQCYPLALVMRPKRNLYHALFFGEPMKTSSNMVYYNLLHFDNKGIFSDNHCHAVWDFCKPNQLTIRADHGLVFHASPAIYPLLSPHLYHFLILSHVQDLAFALLCYRRSNATGSAF